MFKAGIGPSSGLGIPQPNPGSSPSAEHRICTSCTTADVAFFPKSTNCKTTILVLFTRQALHSYFPGESTSHRHTEEPPILTSENRVSASEKLIRIQGAHRTWAENIQPPFPSLSCPQENLASSIKIFTCNQPPSATMGVAPR